MSMPQNFRSAFNGFNREDVVHFIEYLNAKHDAQVAQLNAELELLRTQAATRQEDPALAEELEEARNACAELQAQLESKDQELAQLRQQVEQLRAQMDNIGHLQARENPVNTELEVRCAELERQLEVYRNTPDRELEAYRRAERTERIARERAEQVYRQANGALADATARVDETYIQIGGLTEQVNRQLQELQEAVTGSRQALADAAATLYSIRPDIDGE